MEAICDAISRASESHLRSKGLVNGFKHLQTPLVLLAMLIFGWAYYFNFTPWTLPIGVILVGVAYQALLPFSLRAAARQLREQDQEQGLAYHWAQRRQSAGRNARNGSPSQGVTSDRLRTPSSDAITTPGEPEWSDDRIIGDASPRKQ